MTPVPIVAWIVRWSGFLALAGLVGGFAVDLLVLPPSPPRGGEGRVRGRGGEPMPGLRLRLQALRVGCAGALLVVTLAANTSDYDSEGTPKDWAKAVIDAKGGDDAAVVVFGIGAAKYDGECLAYDRVCKVVELFPYAHAIDFSEPDYGPGFDVATDLVAAACSAFIPR